MSGIKRSLFPKQLIFKAVYYKLGFSLAYRDIVEIFEIEGYKVYHTTIVYWVLNSVIALENNFILRKKKVGCLWRMNPMFVKVKGDWYYLYRAIDENSKTVDYLLTKDRSYQSTYLFLEKAIKNNGVPLLISVSWRSKTLHNFRKAIKEYNKLHSTNIHIAVGAFLSLTLLVDNQVILRRIRNYSTFQNFEAARRTITGIEIFRMIEKNQIKNPAKTHYKTLVSLLK